MLGLSQAVAMSEPFITIAEAVTMTGKSRRTIQRLVETLLKTKPDHVMKERTTRGYIWRISQASVQQAFGRIESTAPSQANGGQPLPAPVPSQSTQLFQPQKFVEVVSQGYTGIMTMHAEVKQIYEERLKDQDIQITQLTQALVQARKGLWARLFGE
jgi:hypothetical protein